MIQEGGKVQYVYCTSCDRELVPLRHAAYSLRCSDGRRLGDREMWDDRLVSFDP